jgi:hypothetical protein
VAITFKFFGPVPELIQEVNPWTGLRDDAPVITLLRAQKVPLAGPASASCASWVAALGEDRLVPAVSGKSGKDWAQAVKQWGPWKPDDAESIDQCAKFPCGVKFDARETAQMAAVPPAERREKFFSLTLARVQRYLRTGERKEYEFAGDPVDPWKRLEELGLKSPLPLPSKPALSIRRVDFLPGRVQTLHQVVDQRFAMASDRQEATLWRRDVYTDHYFDSWGEWTDVSCASGSVTVVQGLLVEVDLMKKNDLVSKLSRSRLRSAIEDSGLLYLTKGFERLRQRASTAGSPAAATSGSSK